MLWERESRRIAPFDQNADSTDELLVYDSEHYIVVRDQQLSVAGSSWNLEPEMEPTGQLGGDGRVAWAAARRNDSLFLIDLWQRRTLFLAATPDLRMSPVWDVSVSAVRFADIDADGDTEAVVATQAGFCRRPRCFMAFDWQSGAREWVFEIGPAVSEVLLRDVDGDGKLEIIAGSAAPGNGNSANGTDDSYSYVFCLNSEGSLRWVRQVGRYGQTASVLWFERAAGAPPCLLVYETGCALEDAEPDSLFLLDPRTGQVLGAAQYGRLNRGCVVLPAVGKGVPLVVLGNTDDTLRLLDAELKLVRKAAMRGMGSLAVCRGSFTAAGRSEFAVATTDGYIRVYDTRLRVLAECRSSNADELATVHGRGQNRLLVRSSPAGRYVSQLIEFGPVPFLARRVSVLVVVLGFLVLLAGFVVLMVAVRYRQTRDFRLVIHSLTGQAGFIELDRRGVVVRTNQRGHDILVQAGNEPVRGRKLGGSGPAAALAELVHSAAADPVGAQGRDAVVNVEAAGSFLARASHVRKGVVLTLEEMTAADYMRRARAWIPAAQRLAHSIKSPLSTIRFAAEQMSGDRSRQAEHIVEQSERIRKMADAIMRLTSLERPEPAPQDVNELVSKTVEAAGLNLRPELGLSLELEPGLPKIRVDENQFSVALENLLDNALAATNGRGQVSVATRRSAAGDAVVVEVADDGPGIPKEDRDRLFQQFFTRKPEGTGLGLMLVKKIAEDHGARVELTSEEGKGTAVRMVFPVV